MKKPVPETREGIIEAHKAMWDWLSKHPTKTKEDWPVWKEYTRRPLFDCFLCDLTRKTPEASIERCHACPGNWTHKQFLTRFYPPCTRTAAPYREWSDAGTWMDNCESKQERADLLKRRRRMAKAIRDICD